MQQSKEDVLQTARERNVKFVSLWFTDILGFLKGFTITIEELESALEDGMGFDGSSIEGFARIDESDMVAMPDPATFQLMPWLEKDDRPTARMFCDILKPGGAPFEGDPRHVLKRNLEQIAAKGLTFYVGPELEYFYFKNSRGTDLLDSSGYFDLIPLDVASEYRRDTALALKSMGIHVQYTHHEVAASQHEIDIRHTDALTMADNVMSYRMAVKRVASDHGVYATFMPKPMFGMNGCGMHVHQSLFRGDQNAFFDKNDEYHLSQEARWYIAGLLKHAPEITAVTNQWVNSYKRLVPGYEAPVYVSWARKSRADLIRVPEYLPGREDATRIEYRSPDPACNPYLAFSVMLAAGLDGVKDKLDCPLPSEENVYDLSDQERAQKGIDTLPASLWQAIQITCNSELVRTALGDHAFHAFIESKKIEWNEYRAQVTQWELDKYLPVL